MESYITDHMKIDETRLRQSGLKQKKGRQLRQIGTDWCTIEKGDDRIGRWENTSGWRNRQGD